MTRKSGPRAEGATPHRGKAATQKRILESAARLFVARGYERTTIADVAKGAGVSRATVFWHFGDKTGLFREAFALLLVPFRESVDRDLQHLSPEKQLEQRVASYLDFVHRHHEIVMGFLGWTVESPVLRTEVVDALMKLHHRYARALAEPLRDLLPTDQDPNAVARGILSMLHGNLLLGLFDPSETAEDGRRASAAAVLALVRRK
ncbi:MAG: TetR/AcrR family transcriptional regulator [Proteobacteria bacterium]|nr:TetR/AcrR family transcriptional regulator [Pseudomonadota bacterium]